MDDDFVCVHSRLSVRLMAQTLNITKITLHEILTNKFQMRKVETSP
jgi:hypothetical protein